MLLDEENDAPQDGRINCWEFRKCGRELGGDRAFELGVCPAYTEVRLDGVHGGRCGGRACWAVSGTICGNLVPSTFAQKFKHCGTCDFYARVKTEEGGNLVPTVKLLVMLD
ncbi:MAG: hypothetical protein OHK006_24360 [Thermodesulfovibrionales bacterium]